MDDAHEDSPQDTPTFTVDEASSAGTEKPAVAADEPEQDGEGQPGLQQQAPNDFAVQDAVSATATDSTRADEK